MEEALAKIAEHSPWAILLIIAVRYLVKKLDRKEEEIKELNLVIRDQQKEGIETMNEVNNILKELTSIIKYGKD
jgi:hypothetical protein